jgi:hypothetical protein
VRIVTFVSKHCRYVAPLCLLAGVFTLGVVGGGCGGSYGQDICNAQCDCTGCSDNDRDSCIKNFDDNNKTSVDVGCSVTTDVYYSCLADRGECHNTDYDIGGCEVEKNKYNNCLAGEKCLDAPTILGQIPGKIECPLP